jgi:hypothetical protein
VFALAALSFLPDARGTVREERSRADAERVAFERFARRVDEMEVGPGRAPTPRTGGADGVGPPDGPVLGGPGSTLAVQGSEDDRLAAVRRAYRDTTMSVEHYDEEYDEGLVASLAAELGEGLATAVVGADRFTPALQETLVDSAENAADRRKGLVRALETEETALRDAGSVLAQAESAAEDATTGPTIDLSFEQLMDRWGRLYDAERRCTDLAEDHQGHIHGRYGVAPRLDGPASLHEYVYQDRPYTHPVLAEVARVVDRLRTAQRRTSTALSRRV